MVVLVFRFAYADSQLMRYFPEGTSFPGGVLVPMHARMVNVSGPIKNDVSIGLLTSVQLLPKETTKPASKLSEDSLCTVQ